MNNIVNVEELIKAIQEKREEDIKSRGGESGMTYSEIINFIRQFARRH